jgi:WhiB family redox-sensing transcriptional regulator
MSAVEAFDDYSPPPTRHEEMLESIARTTFLAEGDRLSTISAEAIAEGNQRIARHIDTPRQLVIVGPDAISFDDQPAVELKRAHTADLLGRMLAFRALAPRSTYTDSGFFRNAGTVDSRNMAFHHTVHALLEITDSTGQPLVSREGQLSTATVGINDVLVTDLRQSAAYETARYSHSLGALTKYILQGGPIPAVCDKGTVRAARQVLRDLAEDDQDSDFYERMSLLNQLTARFLHSRTSELLEGTNLDRSMQFDETTRANRAFVAEAFSGGDPRAACFGPQRKLFFPPTLAFEAKADRQRREGKAKAICTNCDMQIECLERGLLLKTNNDFGIWGGTNADERQKIRAQLTTQRSASPRDSAIEG